MSWQHQKQFNELSWCKPIVYAWYREDVCLYVGMSVCGLARPLSSEHHVVGKRFKPRTTDKLCWSEYTSSTHALLVEGALIKKLKPKYNNYKWKQKQRKLDEAIVLLRHLQSLLKNNNSTEKKSKARHVGSEK